MANWLRPLRFTISLWPPSFLGLTKILDNISSGSWAAVSIMPFARSVPISLSSMAVSSNEKLTLGDITG